MNPSTLSRVFLPRFLSIPVLCGVLMCAQPAAVSAQTATFTGVQTAIGSGFSGPAGVAVDSFGNVFTSDYNTGTVYEILATGGYTTVNPIATGLNKPYGLAVDANDNVFVPEAGAGDVKELVAPSYATVNTIGPAFIEPTGVAVDASDNVYVADYGAGKVFQLLAPAYTAETSLGSGFISPFGVAVDASGNLFVADFGANAVDEVAAPAYTLVTPLGSGFNEPVSVSLDANENVYVSDYGNNLLKEILAAGGYTTVDTLGGTFNSLRQSVVDGSGDVFVADYGGHQVVELQTQAVNFGRRNVCHGGTPAPCSRTLTLNYFVTPATATFTYKALTVGGTGLDFSAAPHAICAPVTGGQACSVDVTFTPLAAGVRAGALVLSDVHGNVLATTYVRGTGVAPEVAFDPAAPVNIGHGWHDPAGVALDGTGDLVVADSGNHRVVEVPISGPAFVVGHGFHHPVGVAVDGAGNIYVADDGLNHVVEILASNGHLVSLGTGLAYPEGVAVDGAGNLFISDPANSRVVEIPSNGGPQVDVGAGLDTPAGLAVDGLGELFIADPGLNKIVEIYPDGQALLGAGLSSPYGVAVDAAGNVYVADSGGSRIEEILSSSQLTLNTTVSGPLGLAVDPAGDIFVADTGHDRVLVLPRINAPSLHFDATFVTQTSADSPRTVQVQNIGNAPLLFPQPGGGTNPNISTGFTFDPSTTCPIVLHTWVSPGELDPGHDCSLAIDFSPVFSGLIHGSATLTDNTFNFNPAHQTIQLEGYGIALYTTHVHLSLASTFLTWDGSTNLTACVTSNVAGPPTGSIDIFDGVTHIATLGLGGDGCAYWYISPSLAAGNHHLKAVYAGQLPYAGSTSNIVAVTVNPVTVNFNVSCWNPSFAYGANYYCTLTASSNAGAAPGHITYKYDTHATVTVPLSGGQASFIILKPVAGSHTVLINYPGAPNFAPAGPVTEHFTVDPAPVNVQLTPSSWYQSQAVPFQFTATVTSWSAGPPDHTGVVRFYNGASLFATVPVNNHGVAVVSRHLSQGTHNITATYSGGANYATGSGTATVTASH